MTPKVFTGFEPVRVVDASAIAKAMVGKDHAAAALRARLLQTNVHAPHLVDAEVGSVLRRHERASVLSPAEADAARIYASRLVDERYPHVGRLADAAWALRHTTTMYDALYAALAAGLGVPLLTADERLSRAPGLPCQIELV